MTMLRSIFNRWLQTMSVMHEHFSVSDLPKGPRSYDLKETRGQLCQDEYAGYVLSFWRKG